MKSLFSSPLLKPLLGRWARIKTQTAAELLLSSKVVVGTLIILTLPLFVLFYSLYHQYIHLAEAEARVHMLEAKAKKTMVARSRAAAFLQQLKAADSNFIATHVQSLKFLQQEEKNLKMLRNTSVLKESLSLIEREQALRNNKIVLQEIRESEENNIKETLYGLQHPIDIDAEDLKILLHAIEQIEPKKPQLMLQSFTLIRKPLSKSYEVFECDFTLLQRNLKE